MMAIKSNLRSTSSLIDLTPLVDVIFLLLIFFVLTSDILPLKSLNVENPSLDRDSPPLTTQLMVIMDAQNVIYLGPRKEMVDLKTLAERLSQEIKRMRIKNPSVEPSIVLSVDRRVEYGTFLRLFSIAQESGPKVRLVYKPSDEHGLDHLSSFRTAR